MYIIKNVEGNCLYMERTLKEMCKSIINSLKELRRQDKITKEELELHLRTKQEFLSIYENKDLN